jgi:hypothetical protein
MYVEVVYIYMDDDIFTVKLSDIEPIAPDTDEEEALTGNIGWTCIMVFRPIQVLGDVRTVNRRTHQGTSRSGMNLALPLSIGKACANKNLRERKEAGRC